MTESIQPTHPQPTTFQEMYDFFLAGITDDMYMELTKEDTEKMLEELLIAAVPHFEFPRWNDPFELDVRHKCFNVELSTTEKIVIRYYMIAEWMGQQLATIDLIRQKYSSAEFKFTSQAAHIKQLMALKEEYERLGFHAQRLYARREKDSKGRVRSTMYKVMNYPSPGGGRRERA